MTLDHHRLLSGFGSCSLGIQQASGIFTLLEMKNRKGCEFCGQAPDREFKMLCDYKPINSFAVLAKPMLPAYQCYCCSCLILTMLHTLGPFVHGEGRILGLLCCMPAGPLGGICIRVSEVSKVTPRSIMRGHTIHGDKSAIHFSQSLAAILQRLGNIMRLFQRCL